MGNMDTVQNSTIYNLGACSGNDCQSSTDFTLSMPIPVLQNTTIGNRDTMQNSTVYLQNTTIGDRDTIQNSTVYDLGLNVVNVSGSNDLDYSPTTLDDNN